MVVNITIPYIIVYKTITASPVKKPIFVQRFAFLLAICASKILPAAIEELTFEAWMIPTMPKGKQQKIVTNMDSVSHVLGGMYRVFPCSVGNKKGCSSANCMAGIHSDSPDFHISVLPVMPFVFSSSKEKGPCLMLFVKI